MIVMLTLETLKSHVKDHNHALINLSAWHAGTLYTNRPDTDCQLSSFVTVTRAEITQLLSKSPSKTCKLDPMPTHFVKQCHDVMAVPITNIISV